MGNLQKTSVWLGDGLSVPAGGGATTAARGLAALPCGHAVRLRQGYGGLGRVTLPMLAAVVGLLGLSARGETNWVIYAEDAYGMTPIQQLTNAVANVQEGDTITLKRGTYVFPDDVFMADNTRTTTSPAYCRFRLNVTTPGITIRGEDASSRKTWTNGSEPVVIDGNGAKAIQIQIANNKGVRIENLTFANCDGGRRTPAATNTEYPNLVDVSRYGAFTTGGAIGIGRQVEGDWNGGHNTVITNCAFRGNKSGQGGAVGSTKVHYFVQDCFFTNNVADNSGGCLFYGNVINCDFVGNGSVGIYMNTATNCWFYGNQPLTGQTIFEGTSASSVVNCLFETNVIPLTMWADIVRAGMVVNCHFTNNVSNVEGMVDALGGTVTNCTFHGNKGGAQGRGTVTDAARVINCRFTSNYGYNCGGVTVRSVTNAQGVVYRSYVKDCYFGDNTTGDGGGAAALRNKMSYEGISADKLAEPVIVLDHCTFEKNYGGSGRNGGAIMNGATNIPEGVAQESLILCTNCVFTGNRASAASGIYRSTAIDCKFFDNIAGTSIYHKGYDAGYSRLIECEITGGNLYHCSVDRSWIHGVTNVCAFNDANYVTNTLVSGCVFPSSHGVVGHYASWDAVPSEFVNCTFVANKGRFFWNTNIVNFVNCAFFNNTNESGVATAVSFSEAKVNNGAITFDHCAFGPLVDAAKPLVGTDLYEIANPRFCAGRKGYESEPYYALLPSSPLRGKGRDVGFSAGDMDLAGHLRLRDGKLDLGCYECWLNPKGMILNVK